MTVHLPWRGTPFERTATGVEASRPDAPCLAVIVARPSATPVAMPWPSTVAKPVLELVQVQAAGAV